jgi:predicted nucleic acid-binding protein
MRSGMTFDTGALIALERRAKRIRDVLDVAREEGLVITVPAAVLAEWCRLGREPAQARLLQPFMVEPTTHRIARIAGEAAGEVGATAVDAIVMASAAQRGDVVYTSDFDDLDRLRRVFPTVTVLRC